MLGTVLLYNLNRCLIMEIDLNRLNSEQLIFIDEDFSIDLNTYKSKKQ